MHTVVVGHNGLSIRVYVILNIRVVEISEDELCEGRLVT